MTSARISWFARRLLPGISAVIIILGITLFSARRADTFLREDLLRQTRIVAMAINPQFLATLTGTNADLNSPSYLRLKEQLTAIRTANPRIRFVSLMGRNPEGKVVMLVDSEPDTSEDYSPPGQIYFEASAPLLATFDSGRETVVGPETDRWGSWVSSFVRLPEASYGSGLILVALDIDGSDWNQTVALQAALPAALGVIVGLLALGATFLQQSRRQHFKKQRELQESEGRFIQLAEQSRTIVWEVDSTGRYTHVSPAVRPILGYTPEELVGHMHFYDLHPEEGREAFKLSALQLIQKKENIVHFENHAQTKEGNQLCLLTNGFPLLNDDGTLRGYRGSDIDITERKHAEEQVKQLLKESNQARQALLSILEDQVRADADRKRLSAAIEQSAESIMVTDANAHIQYVNPAFEKISGYTREEAIGQNPSMLGSGQQDVEFYRELWATLSSGKTWNGRFINRRKDGSLYTEDALISPVCDTTGTVINYVAVKRDITEQLRVTEQLQQSQKMDSIGRLAGGVAHDFNNMLGVILGHAEMAIELIQPEHPIHEDLLEIQKAAERSAALTRQLLAFARKQAATPKVLNLNDTIEGMLKMLRRLIGEDIELRWNPQADLWPIQIDPSQIDQILANLCINARDAIAGVGKITIETHNVVFRPAEAEKQTGATPGDFVRIDFRDTGCGMTPETLGHIFEPFFSTKKKGLGSGLGLATVYGVIKQNNGFIQVHSRLSQGTLFHIFLPRYQGSLEPKPPPTASAPPTGGHESILLVEDEPAILKITGQLIEGLGYSVQKACSPAEAIQWATQQTHEIDLLLTDVVMPEMNGRDLAQKIRKLQPKIKCLFMSGYTADVIARNGVLDKGVHFIEKPFTKQTLAIQIRQALDSPPPSVPQ